MKVAAGAAIVVTAVFFLGSKTGWFDPRSFPPDDTMAAKRIGSSAPSSVQKVFTNSSLDTAPEKRANTKMSDTLTGEAAREELRKSGQYESLGAAFQAARYAPEKIDPAGPHSRGAEYFASNPKQQLRAWFRHDGIELASGRQAKNGNTEPWRVAVRLRASGRVGATVETGPRTVRAEGGRVEMSDADGALTEWYENGTDGLEQGFTFAKAPPGSGLLEIVMSAEGNARPEPLPGAEGDIRFVQSDGTPVVHYTGLKAWDATGRALPAHMQVREAELALVVADAGAQYPVTIDPLFSTLQASLVEGSVDRALGDQFGFSVAVSGNTALVGVPGDDTAGGANTGSSYVFVRSGSGWGQQARLIADDRAAGDAFGSSVALTGDTALIGAYKDDTAAGTNAGSAYLFERTGMIWEQQAKLTASDGAANDLFGVSVALSGDTALVGAGPPKGIIGIVSGSAYVFVRNGTTWPQQTKLTPNAHAPDDGFGASVALDSDTAVVGGPLRDRATGTAYVFVRIGTVWNQQAELTANDGTGYDFFGTSLALGGNMVLVGASRASNADTAAGADAGGVYVYVRSGTVWSQQAKLTANDGSSGDGFGESVALDGNTALVGAPYRDTVAGARDAGSAYLFERIGTAWSRRARLSAEDGAAPDTYFGGSVALSGETALVGAYADDRDRLENGGPGPGRVYAFLVGQTPAIVAQPVSRTVVPGAAIKFSATAIGLAPLLYQWRKSGVKIPGANEPSYLIPSVVKVDEGDYDLVVTNLGGTAASSAAVLRVNDLSEFEGRPVAPSLADPRSAAQGFIVVNLGPPELFDLPGIKPAWRFVGEQEWRTPGVPLGRLQSGDREIEFRAVPRFLHPLREPISIVSGQTATVVEREYFPGADVATGSLSVTMLPASLGGSAQWRLLGDSDWRNSGTTFSGPAGVYLVECKDIAGYATPQPHRVTVATGANPPLTVTYFLKDAAVGTQPGVVGFDAIIASGPNPYTFVGQLRSDSGAGTGFVVRRRVVATAAHVVFDDGTLSAAVGLQWLFQRERDTYEPVPQIPRGSYILSGYAAQRNADATPGTSSAASQNLDVATVWFYEENAARGGSGGYLASDATDNEWLLSERLKTLVGYPLDDVATANQGRMHATPPANISFTHANDRVFLTDNITSRGGNSGGPVCVQYDDGNYFPAAIYLGGTTQTRVRVIDSDVITLFDSAEISSNTGQNSTNGGAPLVNTPPTIPTSATLTVTIEPKEARDAGAGWRIGSGGFLPSGQPIPFLSLGGYTITSKSNILGFVTPSPRSVNLTPNSPAVVITYAVAQVPVITTNAQTLRAIRGRPLPVFTVEATGGPTRFQADGLGGTNLIFNAANGQLSGTPNANGTLRISVVAENSVGSSTPVQFTIIVSDPRKLIVEADPARGRVEVKPKRAGNIFPQGEIVTLTAQPDRPGFLFAGWSFVGATPDSPANATTRFRMGNEAIVVAKANFVPNPFLPRSGSYVGLLTDAGIPAGRAAISLGRTGSFTLEAVIGHAGYSLVGGFDLQGDFTGRIRRFSTSRVDVILHLDLTATGIPTITGTITAEGFTYNLAATHAGTTLPPAGKFTVTLPPDPTQTDAALYPQGYGFALVRVDATGTVVSAVGRLGDGQSFSVGGQFTDDGRWAIYTQPYGNRKRGLLGGEIRFHPAVAPLDGTLRWIKPVTTTGLYTAGFAGSIAAEGSRFRPSDVVALGIMGWNLAIDAGVLPAPLTGTVTLGANGRFTIGGAASGAVTLKLDLATGLIEGTARVGSGVAKPINGFLLPSQRKGRGILWLSDRTGWLTLDPP